MALREINEGISGQEAAEIIYQNDLENKNNADSKIDAAALTNILDADFGLIADADQFVVTDGEGNVAFEVDADGKVNYNDMLTSEVVDENIAAKGIVDLFDDRFAVADPNGYVAFEVLPSGDVNYNGKYETVNGSLITKFESVAAGEIKVINTFPRHSKKGQIFNVVAFIGDFSSGYLEYGFGKLMYRGRYFRITPTAIIAVRYSSSTPNVPENELLSAPYLHGLTISQFISVALYVDDAGIGIFTLTSATGQAKISIPDIGYEINYDPFVAANTINLSNVKASLSNKDFLCNIWGFGDSYFGVSGDRWPGIMKSIGFFNWYVNGLAGQSSAGAILDFKKAIQFGRPKFVLWCLGMNDSDANYDAAYSELVSICTEKHIELILATIPTVPDRSKQYISDKVRNSGFRYVDFATAVNGNNIEGAWFDGMLSADLVHPTALGAKALAAQVLIDFPEIMQQGLI